MYLLCQFRWCGPVHGYTLACATSYPYTDHGLALSRVDRAGRNPGPTIRNPNCISNCRYIMHAQLYRHEREGELVLGTLLTWMLAYTSLCSSRSSLRIDPVIFSPSQFLSGKPPPALSPTCLTGQRCRQNSKTTILTVNFVDFYQDLETASKGTFRGRCFSNHQHVDVGFMITT